MRKHDIDAAMIREFVSKASDKQLGVLVNIMDTCHHFATADCIDDAEDVLMSFPDWWVAFEKSAKELGIDPHEPLVLEEGKQEGA